MSLNSKSGLESSRKHSSKQLEVIKGVKLKEDKEDKEDAKDRIHTTEIAVQKLHETTDAKGWDKLNVTMNSLAEKHDFGQPRAKLGLTSQELERLDKDSDGNSIISKDSNPKEDDEHEEYYQEQDFKNLSSKLMPQSIN